MVNLNGQNGFKEDKIKIINDQMKERAKIIIEREFEAEILLQKRHIRSIEAEIQRGKLIMETLNQMLRKNSRLLSIPAIITTTVDQQQLLEKEDYNLRRNFISPIIQSAPPVITQNQPPIGKRRPGRPRLSERVDKSRIIVLKLPYVDQSTGKRSLIIKLKKNGDYSQPGSILNQLHDSIQSIDRKTPPDQKRSSIFQGQSTSDVQKDLLNEIDLLSEDELSVTGTSVSGFESSSCNANETPSPFELNIPPKSSFYISRQLLVEQVMRRVSDNAYKVFIDIKSYQSDLLSIIDQIQIKVFKDGQLQNSFDLTTQPFKFVLDIDSPIVIRSQVLFCSKNAVKKKLYEFFIDVNVDDTLQVNGMSKRSVQNFNLNLNKMTQFEPLSNQVITQINSYDIKKDSNSDLVKKHQVSKSSVQYCIFCGIGIKGDLSEVHDDKLWVDHIHNCIMKPINKKGRIRQKLISYSVPTLILKGVDLVNSHQTISDQQHAKYPIIDEYIECPNVPSIAYALHQSIPPAVDQDYENFTDIFDVLSEPENLWPIQSLYQSLSPENKPKLLQTNPNTLSFISVAAKLFLKKIMDESIQIIEEEINEDQDEEQMKNIENPDKRLLTPYHVYRALFNKKEQEFDFLMNSYMESFPKEVPKESQKENDQQVVNAQSN